MSITPHRRRRAPSSVNHGDSAIVCERLSKTYTRGTHDVHALVDVSLDIEPGRLVVLLGPSGSGKTTLLNLVGAIEPITAGSIVVDGVDVASLAGTELTGFRRREVGFVFQFFNLVPTLTAAENVEVIAELTGPDAATRAVTALAEVGLVDRRDHFPGQLSGGEQQRVAIARALVKGAPVLLADEPTGSLDLETGKQVLGLLRDTTSTGRTVLLVTHNSAIAHIADRVIHLRDGHVAGDHRNPTPRPVAEVTW
ncbi:MAG: ABC transporter ATP-binding protein [Acidimicrobiia bacterium]|nr:ABC transporter ATP-binding protein [Acidimicrobiia bacterium]